MMLTRMTLLVSVLVLAPGFSWADDAAPLQISGIYPHLAAFNGHGECGIGAVVPWADRLWWITYPPHFRQGSNDKLYSINERFELTVHPESVGGTHAGRMIHEPSGQLLLGPYVIRADGQVRALDVQSIPGRYTGFARHLTDPERKVYLFDMEGPIWEIDVHTLAGKRLFVKPVPGWHGKAAHTGQHRLLVANNGEASAAGDLPPDWEWPQEKWSREPEDAGALAEYDGDTWHVVERRPFVEVAGPGGLRASDPEAPVWAVGWDRRSVLLLMREHGRWSRWRLPKASHAMDPQHGWYTEWPRLRPVSEHEALLCMHGMFYQFPLSFRSAEARGIRPLCSHLRYVTDFCVWNEQLVISADDTSIMQNPLAGQSQSNLWFGERDELLEWGPAMAFGGPWLGDQVPAETPSDPYLFAGFSGRMVHLAAGEGPAVEVTIELDTSGQGDWQIWDRVTVPGNGYTHQVFPDELAGEWIRFRLSRPATVSAYLHYRSRAGRESWPPAEDFAGFASNEAPARPILVRPAAHNRRLQVLVGPPSSDAQSVAREASSDWKYYEVDERLQFHALSDVERLQEAAEILQLDSRVHDDEASAVILADDGRRYRLPRVPGTTSRGRDVREVQSERSLAHIGNIFYEVPRGEAGKHVLDIRRLRPVAAHRHAIFDFCSWRGLLVLSGVRADAAADDHVFRSPDGEAALWLGAIDDLWKLGKPVGEGGPWKNSPVDAGTVSDPYLMTGFDRKTLRLSHDAPHPVRFRIEVDYSNRDFWKLYDQVTVPSGETIVLEFPQGYSAHWCRLVSEDACRATAWFIYE